MNKKLILESGDIFHGTSFGAGEETEGEVVFNTAMTGYQEVISDLSYHNQIVCMTYPLIGNYGINSDDFENLTPTIQGLIIKELSDLPSNFRSQMTLDEFFKKKKILGIQGIDTRKLTRILRDKGVMKGKIVDENRDNQEVIEELKQSNKPLHQVAEVSTQTAYASPGRGFKVVVIDLGAKLGIIRELSKRHCDTVVVPHHTSAEDILLLNPNGIVLSSGPGNPTDNPQTVEIIQTLLGRVPIFGIGLGHLLLGLACGAKTYKLKSGHRGNHPVLDLSENKVRITSQNHGYAIEQASLQHTDLIETHIALNDRTNEGFKHSNYPCFSVQFNPESSPGPEDANYLFDDFIEMIKQFKNNKNQL